MSGPGATDEPVTVSAVMNTRNAAAMLDEALTSVRQWVDEIVVVDMHSTDDTRKIAERHGARVLLHEPLGFADPARAWSAEQATGDWILSLDADEVVPRQLSERLRAIAAIDEADVVDIPELNYFFGAPMLYGGWHPQQQRHFRFFKKGKLDLSPRVHVSHRVAEDARVLELLYEPELAIIHFAYTTIGEFIDRTNRYAALDTEEPPGPLRRQVRHGNQEVYLRLITLRGVRDGSRGVVLALLMGVYEWILWLKRVERHRPAALRCTGAPKFTAWCVDRIVAALKRLEKRMWPSPEEIRSIYLSEARRLCAEYAQ